MIDCLKEVGTTQVARDSLNIEVKKQASWSAQDPMLMKVRHDLPEVGFVKVPRDDKGSVRMFVNVAAEHIMKLRQSQASVCLWWNVNSRNNDQWNLAGQIECRYSWGHTISCWSWNTLLHLWFYRPLLFCPSVKQKSYQTALQRCPGPSVWAMFQSNKGCYSPSCPVGNLSWL